MLTVLPDAAPCMALDVYKRQIQHSYFGSTGEIQIESQSGLGDAVLASFGVSGIAQTDVYKRQTSTVSTKASAL